MNWRSWATFVGSLVAGFLAFVAVESSFSPHFQACIAGAQNPYDSNPPEHYPATFAPRSPAAFIECTGGYINAYGPAINALGTLVIAAFTATLWVATSRQAALTKDALIADKRASVHPSALNQFWLKDAKTGLYTWTFRVVLKNTGGTPTKDLRVTCECELRNSPYPSGYITVEDPSHVVRGIIPPADGVTGPAVPWAPAPQFTAQDILDIQAGTKIAYIWGVVRYFDVFPGTKGHVTKFRWMLNVTGDPRKFVPNSPGPPPAKGALAFGYTHAPDGNSADDE